MDVLALVVFATAGWEGACRRRNLTSIHPLSSAKAPEKKERGLRAGGGLTSARDEARDIFIVEAVYALEIPIQQD